MTSPGSRPWGAVLRVEGELIGGHSEQEGSPLALHVALGQLQGAADGPDLPLGEQVRPGEVVLGLGVEQPVLPAQGDLLLGGGVEEGGFPGGVSGDELLAEGESVGEVVRRVGHDVQVYAAVRLGQAGLGERTSLAAAWLSPKNTMPRPGTAQAQKKRRTNSRWSFFFTMLPAFLKI